jgi:hypothetical protein
MFRAVSALFACLMLAGAATATHAQVAPSPTSGSVTVTLPTQETATATAPRLDLRTLGFLSQLASHAWLSGAVPSAQAWNAAVVPSGSWLKTTRGVLRDRPAIRDRRAVGTR